MFSITIGMLCLATFKSSCLGILLLVTATAYLDVTIFVFNSLSFYDRHLNLPLSVVESVDLVTTLEGRARLSRPEGLRYRAKSGKV
jgi:hypothetical protein